MSTVAPSLRLHLLPAKRLPWVVILARVRSRLWHVVRWNTTTDEWTPGSWFRGALQPLRSDVSFDGDWMVYFAMGPASAVDTWTAICRAPSLQASRQWRGSGASGGGVWLAPDRLVVDTGASSRRSLDPPRVGRVGASAPVPFRLEAAHDHPTFRSEGLLPLRLERDGWRRAPARHGRDPVVLPAGNPSAGMPFATTDWTSQPTSRHPVLRMTHARRRGGGEDVFLFEVDGKPGLLHRDVSWATWDAAGQLIAARRGRVERYTFEDLERGTPSLVRDLTGLAPERTEPSTRIRP